VYPPELIENWWICASARAFSWFVTIFITNWSLMAKKPLPAYRFTKRDGRFAHVIVVNGVAKVYGMTGFRVGGWLRRANWCG
jgi:hypothetical protein